MTSAGSPHDHSITLIMPGTPSRTVLDPACHADQVLAVQNALELLDAILYKSSALDLLGAILYESSARALLTA